MICSNCNKEIADDSLYCIYCHAPTGLESDIDVRLDILEDDELLQTYREEQSKKRNKKNSEKKTSKGKGFHNIELIFVGVLVICIISAVVGIYVNSFSYSIKKADKLYDSSDYKNAIVYYEKSFNKEESNIDALIGIGKSYIGLEEYEKAENAFLLALEKSPESTEAFDALMSYYASTKDQEKMMLVYEEYSDSVGFDKIYEKYAIPMPEFSLSPDNVYTEDKLLEIDFNPEYSVYYSLDGKDPREGSGELYDGPIKLTDGITRISACCYDGTTFGLVNTETFTVKYDTPDYPTVSPMYGTFYEPTFITISTDFDNAKIYYTWDGSDPSASSSLYTEPILVPEGNSELAVVVISETGKSSGVLRCSYTCLY